MEHLSTNTKRTYRHWCKKLLNHTQKPTIKAITQEDLDSFFAWMVRPMGYPRSTVNQAKSAVKHYAVANELEFDIKLVSARTDNHRPNLINEAQAARIIGQLAAPYEEIARYIFYDCRQPRQALAQAESVLAGTLRPPGTTVHRQTFNDKLKEAAAACGILEPLAAKALQQSGIVHALNNGVDRDYLMARAGIGLSTVLRYVRWANLCAAED